MAVQETSVERVIFMMNRFKFEFGPAGLEAIELSSLMLWTACFLDDLLFQFSLALLI